MRCQSTGRTRILFRDIPHFRKIAITSFSCENCGEENRDIIEADDFQIKGCICKLKVRTSDDLQRMVIKSSHAVIYFHKLELEIPSQIAQMTTVEGILQKVRGDLTANMKSHKEAYQGQYGKLVDFINQVEKILNGKSLPIDMEINDPSGNSFIEPKIGVDSGWSFENYLRTDEQNKQLGLMINSDSGGAENEKDHVESNGTGAEAIDTKAQVSLNDELQIFSARCPNCCGNCSEVVKPVDIPYFKQVIIMSLYCENCGYKNSEVKTGGEIPRLGRKIRFNVKTFPDDLSRDILKSDSAALQIPEINLELTPGTLGGRFTTIEGLLQQTYDELYSKILVRNSDSMPKEQAQKWEIFLKDLKDLTEGKRTFTMILDDPLAASHLQNPYAPDSDPEMQVENYERSFEQNEELGINDMKTEDYE